MRPWIKNVQEIFMLGMNFEWRSFSEPSQRMCCHLLANMSRGFHGSIECYKTIHMTKCHQLSPTRKMWKMCRISFSLIVKAILTPTNILHHWLKCTKPSTPPLDGFHLQPETNAESLWRRTDPHSYTSPLSYPPPLLTLLSCLLSYLLHSSPAFFSPMPPPPPLPSSPVSDPFHSSSLLLFCPLPCSSCSILLYRLKHGRSSLVGIIWVDSVSGQKVKTLIVSLPPAQPTQLVPFSSNSVESGFTWRVCLWCDVETWRLKTCSWSDIRQTTTIKLLQIFSKCQ